MDDVRRGLAVLRAAAGDGRLDALCDRLGIDLVSVFGSAVRSARPGDPEPADLDVAVRFGGSTGRDVLGVVNALSELAGVERVDVMDLARAGIVARSRALGPGALPLYERHRGDYARAQMAALTLEMDTEHLRRLDLQLLASR